MFDRPQRRPPPIEDRDWLRALPAAMRLSFRGGPQAVEAVSRAFGVALPTVACRALSVGERAALWLGPDEYLLIAAAADGTTLALSLEAALGALPHSIVDVSHRQVAFALHGPYAEWLLLCGCPLDLDLGQFPVGSCTRTVFHKAEILLWRTDQTTFRVEVWRSFAGYVQALLDECARELSA